MRGFKLFLESASADVTQLCAKIMENKDGVLNFNILADLLDELQNHSKASYIRRLLELNPKYLDDGDIFGFRSMALMTLAYNGRKGFCTPLTLDGYEAWEAGDKTPSVGFRITLQEMDRVPLYNDEQTFLMGDCPFKESICKTAAEKQMGVGQLINENFDPSQFDFTKIKINFAHTWPEDGRNGVQHINSTSYLNNPEVLKGVEQRIRRHIKNKNLGYLDVNTIRGREYTKIRNDLEEYHGVMFLYEHSGVSDA